MAVVSFSARPPAEAVAYLQDKVVGGRFSFDWRDMWQDEHLSSFVVAKMASADLLADVHSALTTAISEGWTRQRFIDELRPTLQAKGWWGRKEQTDPLTGEIREVQLGSPRRLTTIFDTNMRMAHAAGRWQRFEGAKAALPYLVYTAVLDERTRPQHARWGGRGGARVILPIDHPFWRTHYPPNGWRCRCIVMAMSAQMLQARGWSVTTEEELTALEWVKTRPWLDRRNGRMMTVPVGIDPGFAYNVGLARRAALAPPPVPEPQRDLVEEPRLPRALPPPHPPRPYPPGVTKRPELAGEQVFEAFSRVLGVEGGGVFVDRVQIPLAIEPRLFEARDELGRPVAVKGDKRGRGPYAEVMAATLRDPDEIWSSFQRQRDGSVRLVRSYVGAWIDPDGEHFQMAVTFMNGGSWIGVTAYPPGKPGKPANQAGNTARNFRVGALLYRRQK